jgi:HupE / UreJ protein
LIVRRAAALLALILAALFAAPDARAHAMRSVMIEIDEIAPGNAAVHVRTSVPGAPVTTAIAGCTLRLDEGDLDRGGIATCDDSKLAGHTVSLEGLGPVLSEAVVWIRYSDGASFSHLLGPDDASWSLPSRGSAWAVARQYVGLGVAHILTGYDHLLFLLLLVLALRRPRAVLLAETAFTVSHSISFSATALGWVRVSPVFAEACIALSLVLVALDVGKPARAGAGLAFLFGLVHGLGFAGGLREIGLPESDVGAALVSFGAGVEIGQVAFLALVLAVAHFGQRLRAWPKLELAGTYCGGAVASSWLVERVIACLG